MRIQVNTDSNIEGREKLTAHVRSVVESALNRFSEVIRSHGWKSTSVTRTVTRAVRTTNAV